MEPDLMTDNAVTSNLDLQVNIVEKRESVFVLEPAGSVNTITSKSLQEIVERIFASWLEFDHYLEAVQKKRCADLGAKINPKSKRTTVLFLPTSTLISTMRRTVGCTSNSGTLQ